ncbi:LysR family transcriptional regulator [Ruegeria sp. HKCCD4318-2]|nr:LysR family transcriptional regulator [Ruegeria sp. HKCCD4318]NOD89856.1 LysR family transcriptional regulator [Ruegeria sp. HKCCD4318]NOE14698.1 LysR family transcriptional regulator [Ruegeria sp. HKCCD4318-2]
MRRVPSMSPLIAFEAVARLGSVTLAAEELNTSQSAISRHIRNLEERFSLELFQRDGRGIALTAAGKSYHAAV